MPDDRLDLISSQTVLSGALSSSAFDHGRFAPGTVLAQRYRIIAMLGRGGMGEVYRADDLTLGQSVALKFLPENIDRDREKVERLLAEVRTARQVSHPNVCRVHDVGHVDGHRFISMEYIDGEDLSVLLQRIGRLPADKAVEIARQLCAGLAASHDRGVLHRDLKPANIMLDGRGRVRITDFGLATALLADGKALGEFAGTPAYMAPEQLDGKPVSMQTDIYALGLVLYEIFTGKRFHSVRNLDELRQRHAGDPSLDLSSSDSVLDPAVARVLERCLESEPGRRPKSCAQVAASLPGGDPLAAAIAAGETPSPQLVAASAVQGALGPRVALALGVLHIAAVFALAIWSWNPPRVFGITRSAEVLSAQSRDFLAGLGYAQEPVDTAAGFRYRYTDWRTPGMAQDAKPWSKLTGLRPAAVYFWYREHQSPMSTAEAGRIGYEFLSFPLRSINGPSSSDPPLEPGSILIERTPDGRLDTLYVRPDPQASVTPATAPVDWSRLFQEARLDIREFAEAAPLTALAVPGDRRLAWVQRPSEGRDLLRVEAAESAGRPIMFRVLASQTPLELGATPYLLGGTGSSFGWTIAIGTLCMGYLGAAYFMRKNSVTGRGDRRGAARLARVVAGLVFTSALLTASPPVDMRLVGTAHGAVAIALFAGAFVWVFYMAIEPFVRRQWPRAMIGWSRLMAGEWRDPQVGREVFLGALTAVVTKLLVEFARIVESWTGREPPLLEQFSFRALSNARELTAGLLQLVPYTMIISLLWVVLLLLLRRLVRTDLAAILVLSAVTCGLTPNVGWFVGAAFLVSSIVALLFTIRYGGFLALVANIVVGQATLALPFVPGTPGFVGSYSWIVVGTTTAMAMFGLYTALAGQSIFGSAAEAD